MNFKFEFKLRGSSIDKQNSNLSFSFSYAKRGFNALVCLLSLYIQFLLVNAIQIWIY